MAVVAVAVREAVSEAVGVVSVAVEAVGVVALASSLRGSLRVSSCFSESFLSRSCFHLGTQGSLEGVALSESFLSLFTLTTSSSSSSSLAESLLLAGVLVHSPDGVEMFSPESLLASSEEEGLLATGEELVDINVSEKSTLLLEPVGLPEGTNSLNTRLRLVVLEVVLEEA